MARPRPEDRVAVADERDSLDDRPLGRRVLVDLGIRTRSPCTLQQGRPNRIRVLESRVVVGDDQDVAALDRGAAHVVAFALVTVTIGAEEHEHAPRRDAADRGERLLEGIGGVAEIDVDRGTSGARDELGSTGQVRADDVIVEGPRDAFPVVAGLEDHDDRLGGVGGHVAPDHRHRRGQRATSGTRQAETCAVGQFVEDLDSPVSCCCRIRGGGDRGGSDRDVGHLAGSDDIGAGGRVEADHGSARAVGAKERELGLKVLSHIGVVVEVIVREIGEARNIEHDPVHTLAAQGLGADLDGDCLDAALAHEGEQGVHLVGLGSGEAGHDDIAGDVAFGG